MGINQLGYIYFAIQNIRNVRPGKVKNQIGLVDRILTLQELRSYLLNRSSTELKFSLEVMTIKTKRGGDILKDI